MLPARPCARVARDALAGDPSSVFLNQPISAWPSVCRPLSLLRARAPVRACVHALCLRTRTRSFRFSGLVRANTVNVTVNQDKKLKAGTRHNLLVVAGQAGTSAAKIGKLKGGKHVGGKKGKSVARGYRYNALRINAAAAATGTRHSIRRAALARFSKLTAANKPVSAGRERKTR
jgi:hypothetical protein